MTKARKHTIIFICVSFVLVVVALVSLSTGKAGTGDGLFEGIKADDLYYVCRVSRTAPQIIFLEADEIDEFADLMGSLDVTPASWDEFRQLEGAYVDKWFVFEQTSHKGEMIKAICFSRGEVPGSKKWLIINEKIYNIREDTYNRFCTLLDSIQY